MTDNKLFFWSLIFASAYWITGVFIPTYHSTFASAMLLIFGAVALARYGPEAFRIVVYRHRNPDDAGGGSHLAAYGVALLSAGSVYVGLFGVAWVMSGQPETWLATPVSGFGRYIMAAGFGLLFFSPDMEQHRLKLPGRAWLLLACAVALILSFYLGLQIGSKDERQSMRMTAECPEDFPIKAKRTGVYHLPGGRYYDRTDPDACFASPRMASAFGLRKGTE